MAQRNGAVAPLRLENRADAASEPVLAADQFAPTRHAGPLDAVEVIAVALVAGGFAQPLHAALDRLENLGRIAGGEGARVGPAVRGLAVIHVEDQEHAGQAGRRHVRIRAPFRTDIAPPAVVCLTRAEVFREGGPELVAGVETGPRRRPDAEHAVLRAGVVPVGGFHLVAPTFLLAEGSQQPVVVLFQQILVGFLVGELPQRVLPDVGAESADVGVVRLLLGEPVERLAQPVVGGGVGAGGQERQGGQRRLALVSDRSFSGLLAAEVVDRIVDGGANLRGGHGRRERLVNAGRAVAGGNSARSFLALYPQPGGHQHDEHDDGSDHGLSPHGGVGGRTCGNVMPIESWY